MAQDITIFAGTTGLNNRMDPARLTIDLDTGLCELAAALDVDIDDTGRVDRRKGMVATAVTGSCHSLFCDAGECLFGKGASLYRLNSDYSATTITTIAPGRRISYLQTLDPANKPRIFWCNGVQRGWVREGVNTDWNSGNTGTNYIGPYTSRPLADPPNGIHLLEMFSGWMMAAREDEIYVSEYMDFFTFDRHRRINMGDRVTMMRAVKGGMYVGTTRRTYWLPGEAPSELGKDTAEESPTVEGSDVSSVPASALRLENVSGNGAMWTSHKGVCWGGPEGLFINLTEHKLVIPTARYASAVYRDDVHKYVVLLQP